MNCSEDRRLHRLLSRIWQELRGANASISTQGWAPKGGGEAAAAAGGEDDAYLYILLIMIFYGCLAGGLILAYTRSRKLESKHDPYHLYIERDWTGGAGVGGPQAAEPGLDPQDRRSSGESEHL